MIRLVLVFIIGIISSNFACHRIDNKKENVNDVAAKVYDRVLSVEEVLVNIPLTSDSTLYYNNYVDRWVRKHIYLHEAEKEVSKNIEIDKLVNDYKESLVLYHFENQVADEYVDTSISEDDKRSVFEEDQEMFVLSDDLYLICRLYAGTADLDLISELKEGVEKANSVEEIASIGEENNLPTDTLWITHLDLINLVGKDQFEKLLQSDEKVFIRDCLDVPCLNKLLRKVDKNSLAPFSYVEEEIVKHIFAQRKKRAVEQVKEELYQNAIKADKVKVNYQ